MRTTPFASGHHICLGNNFSLLETHAIATILARRFKVRLKPGHRPSSTPWACCG